jgi:hypothetical protein
VLFGEADVRLHAHLGTRRTDVISALSALKDASETALLELRVARSEIAG